MRARFTNLHVTSARSRTKDINHTADQALRLLFLDWLQQDNQRLNWLQTYGAAGYGLLDMASPQQLWMNTAFWQTLGFPTPQPLAQCIASADFPAFQAKIKHLRQAQEPKPILSLRLRLVGKQQKGLWYWLSLRPIVSEAQDKPMLLLAFRPDELAANASDSPSASEVAETRQPETTSLSEPDSWSSPYLQLLEEANQMAQIGDWLLDLSKMQLVLSSAGSKLLQVPPQRPLKWTQFLALIKDEADRERLQRACEQARQQGQGFELELKVYPEPGPGIHVVLTGTPSGEQSARRWIYGLIQNVDQQVKDHQALSLKEEQLRQTFQYAASGMALFDLQGEWIRYNESLAQMTGYTYAELQDLSMLKLVHPSDRRRLLQQGRNMLAGSGEHYHGMMPMDQYGVCYRSRSFKTSKSSPCTSWRR